MTTPDGGNGTKLKVEVHETKIDMLLEGQKEILAILNTYFGPEGICPKTRAASEAFRVEVTQKRETIYTHIKGLWAVITFIVGAIISVVVELVRRS